MHQSTFLAAILSAGAALAAPATPAQLAAAASSSAAANGVKCPIVFDGRVPTGTVGTFFDSSNALFNPDYVRASAVPWSSILKFPTGEPSKFDGTTYEAVEVTINDQSIFQTQNGFRRAGLQFASDSSSGPGQTGVKTLHWSVKLDPQRAFNLSHEYLVIFSWESGVSVERIRIDFGNRTYGTKPQTTPPINSNSKPAP